MLLGKAAEPSKISAEIISANGEVRSIMLADFFYMHGMEKNAG